MYITIFTPTYNRASKLKFLYESLKKQTYKNFEWLIVDDGSTDNTDDFVKALCHNKDFFKINYYKQENSGKHIAINYGLKFAKGELFFIVDSDDYLPENSLETIIKWINTCPLNGEYAGVGGLKGYIKGGVVGESFKKEFVDCTSLERKKYSIEGDKAEVFFTDILKKYSFPKFDGENFLTESVVWYRIASDDYKIRWFNEIIYLCEYCEDGLTNAKSKFFDNYNGFILQVSEEITYKEISFKEKVKKLCICLGYSKFKKIKTKHVANKLKINVILAKILRFIGYIILKYVYHKDYR